VNTVEPNNDERFQLYDRPVVKTGAMMSSRSACVWIVWVAFQLVCCHAALDGATDEHHSPPTHVLYTHSVPTFAPSPHSSPSLAPSPHPPPSPRRDTPGILPSPYGGAREKRSVVDSPISGSGQQYSLDAFYPMMASASDYGKGHKSKAKKSGYSNVKGKKGHDHKSSFKGKKSDKKGIYKKGDLKKKRKKEG